VSLAEKALFAFSLVIYCFGAERQVRALFGRGGPLGGRMAWVLTLGLILHLAAFAVRAAASQPQRLPLSGVAETLSSLAWFLVLSWMLLELRWRIPGLGAFALPLAVALGFAGLVGMVRGAPVFALESPVVGVHIVLSLLGYAAFALAFCTAVAYLLQDRLLRAKRLTGLSEQLPPVILSDESSYRLVALGLPVFTLGLLLGAVFARLRGEIPGRDPKEIWGYLTWLIFAAYLLVRTIRGWRGRRAAALLVVGFASLLITYLGVGHTLAR
jgi:ABC-type transport system involved in cytochrome c biogenesis permease subunit